MQALYSAVTGLEGQQARLDVISSNIANSSTTGYKSARVDFKDALYSAMAVPKGDAEASNLLTGSGLMVGGTVRDFDRGPVNATGKPLDFALTGNGFFTVQDENGNILYTRDGSFKISPEGNWLITNKGNYVLDSTGNRIAIPGGTSGLAVSGDGQLGKAGSTLATLGIADFQNPNGLSSTGDNCYTATLTSGNAVPAQAPGVVQGSLEGSNVNLADEMTLMMRSQRIYSLSGKALQTEDEMNGLSNNMH